MIAAVLADAREAMRATLAASGYAVEPRPVTSRRTASSHPPALLAQVRLEVRAMTSCPWRGRKVECGCHGARLCGLLRGESGRVTALDCQRCPVAMATLLGSLGRMLSDGSRR